jgi:hypothetical protein
MKYLVPLILLFACTSQPVIVPNPEVPVLEVPEAPQSELKADWPQEYTNYFLLHLEAHGQDLLKAQPKDIAEYCPGYEGLSLTKKKQMWLNIASALAKFESNWKPRAYYLEKFPDSKGNRVESVGLFQMSKESQANYFCGMKTNEDLYSPSNNILCFVKAANILVPQGNKYKSPAKTVRPDSYIGGQALGSRWQGLGAFWSPFRFKDKLDTIKKAARKACQ